MDFAFIDSGMGGIPYMMRLLSVSGSLSAAEGRVPSSSGVSKRPIHSAVYLADTAAFPYGTKSSEEVKDCALRVVGKAIKMWQPSVVVVACNTISVHALGALRAAFATPIVGTVPAIRLAAEVTQNGRIGFLATDATVAASYSKDLASRYAVGCSVCPLGAPELVRFVEERIADADEAERESAVLPYIEHFASLGCDTIILGCTHFTHLADTFERVAGRLIPGVKVVDSRDGVARQALKVWGLSGVAPVMSGSPSAAEGGVSRCAMTGGRHIGDYTPPAVYVTGGESVVWQRLCARLGLIWGGSISAD